ncbi:MAG: SigB/SigF/SigG family RNA polymerase sigma factor [Clostridiales bacterium]|jgi:RNA polymerase sporulation-specific sigma factor|nr:SigB/SigF/SigG family RNA polymerase sigma factor [Clostridiales bacterium]
MLSHEETMRLLKLAKNGDNDSKTVLIEQNMPLIKSIVRRYKNKRVEYDDLVQIGTIGIIKAIKNFNEDFNVRFSTYAVPMIAGEIKRFIRDDGIVKVSRSLKTLAVKIGGFIDRFKSKNGKDPTLSELAEEFDISQEDVVFALDSSKFPLSLYEKTDDENGQCLMDKLACEDDQDDMIDKMMLKDIIGELPDREKKIILFRYFRDKTQSEVAGILGVSQVQVSRLESRIIEKLKRGIV